MIFAGPAVPVGTTRPEVTSLASIAPTLEALAGLPPSDALDGRDLSRDWRAASVPGDHWAYAEGMASQLDHGWSPLFAIRTEDHAFIRAPRPELYEVGSDPGQQQNRLGSGEIPARLEGPVREANARIDRAHARSHAAVEVSLDATTRAQIESLGYVVPVAPAVASGADPKDVHHLAELQYSVNAHYFGGRLDDALALAERGLEDLPDSPMLLDMLARIWAAKGEPTKALPHAERAARAVPEWVGYWVQLGDLQLATGAIDAAVATYQRGIEVAPEDPDARAGSVWRCLRGEVEQAHEDARIALEHGGDWAGRYEAIGNTWERCGQYETAMAVYLAGAERHPEERRLQMRLAIQWARNGERARSDAARARAGKAGTDPELVCFLAVAHAVRGETSRAEELLRSVLVSHPGHPLAERFLARMLADRARPSVPPPARASDAPEP